MEKRPNFLGERSPDNECILLDKDNLIMATYISAAVIARIIKDPNMDKPLMPRTIWKYHHKDSGVILYAVFYEEEHDIHSSPYVTLPYLLWDHGELTTYGEEFMKVQSQQCNLL